MAGMQIKTIRDNISHPQKSLKLKRLTISIGENAKQLELILLWEYKIVQLLWKAIWRCITILNVTWHVTNFSSRFFFIQEK